MTPPLAVDMVGYLRRWEPATRYGEPLEVGALVLDDGEHRVALVAWDSLGTPGDYALRFRTAVAEAAGCDVSGVLVNSSHTHAAPPPPEMLKIGGTTHDPTAGEAAYAETAIGLAASAAALARERLQPASVRAARSHVDGLGVNRRQRTESATILGWNPEGACDPDVAVLAVDSLGGDAIATVVSYGCHPVVVGWAPSELSSDFVGPLRRRVRGWVGGECLFLQGCAGNVLPLEAFFDAPGPERRFGDRLALAALEARSRPDFETSDLRQQPTSSAVPIAIWRRGPSAGAAASRVEATEERVELPLLEAPSPDELAAIEADLEERVRTLQEEGTPRSTWNPLWIHREWARRMQRLAVDGARPSARTSTLQALRIGPVGLLGWPGEPFSELGLELKARSPAPFTVPLGYTNDLVGYLPTREEYQYGGYEPAISQRHFGNPSPFAPEAGEMLVERGLSLLQQLFVADLT